MAEKERKKKAGKTDFQSAASTAPAAETTAEPAATPAADTAGSMLRKAREEKGLSLQDVSNAIHLRVSQIRALEEHDLKQLPGITYAVGFVRSYAKFLKLDSETLVLRFKAENGAAGAPKPELHFPEPIVEAKTPGPMIVGVSTILAVVLLVVWAIFSDGGNDAAEVAADAVPPVETVVAASDTATSAEATPAPASPDAADAPAADTSATTTAAADTPATVDAPKAIVTLPVEADAKDTAAKDTAVKADKAASATDDVQPPPATTGTAVPAEQATKSADDAKSETVKEDTAAKATADAATDEQILVKQPKGRVMLVANESSWVQVSDSSGRVVFKKVLKKGEKYYVPDQRGMSIVTSNAGGFDVYVDGGKVANLGRSGDIVRGVALDPQSLKQRRASLIRNY